MTEAKAHLALIGKMRPETSVFQIGLLITSLLITTIRNASEFFPIDFHTMALNGNKHTFT